MITARTARTLAAFALVVAAFAALAAILTPAPAAHALQTPAPAVAEVSTPAAAAEAPVEAYTPVDAFLPTLLGDTDLPAGQAEAFDLAADRVCEGMTAGVPLVDMADTLAGEFGFTDEEAHEFVRTASAIRCTVAP